jgi:hypothetical protein
MYLLYLSEMQRSPTEKWPHPFGLRPIWSYASLLVVPLESPNFSPRALPSSKLDSNTILSISVSRPVTIIGYNSSHSLSNQSANQMLIVVSPAKSLDYESPLATTSATKPQFMDQSELLIEQLREFSPPQVSELMGISAKLGDLNFGRYLSWKPKATRKNARPAVLAFTGDVYQGLQANSFSEEDFKYAQEHIRIISGLYGLLRPLDLMQPYRLEMGTKLKTERGSNLYDFWGDQITETLNKQLKKTRSDVLLNLASKEYFSAVRPKLIKAQIVSPVFRDYKSGKYKIISFFAKKARGGMSRWVIQNQIEGLAQIKDFDLDGYRYNAAASTDNKPVFLRDAQ